VRDLLIVATVLLSGCVRVEEPLPQRTHPDFQGVFEGIWDSGGTARDHDRILHVEFTSEDEGRVAVVSWERDSFVLEQFRLRVLPAEDPTEGQGLLSVEELGDPPSRDVAGYRVIQQGDDLLVRPPSQPVLEELIAEGQLEGEQKDNVVHLRMSGEELLGAILEERGRAWFDDEMSVVYRRIQPTKTD
jgi:hypothetical protein